MLFIWSLTLLVLLSAPNCAFCVSSSPPILDRGHSFILPSDAGRVYRGAVTSDEQTDSIFVATLRRPAQVYKLAVSPQSGKLRLASSIVLNENEDSSHAIFFDRLTQFLWVGCSTPRGLPGHIAIVENTASGLQRHSGFTLYPNEVDVYSIVAPPVSLTQPAQNSAAKLYIGLHSRPARIVEATRHHIHRTRGLAMQQHDRVFAMAIPGGSDGDDDESSSSSDFLFATVGGRLAPAVVKVDLKTFSVVDELFLNRLTEKDPTTIIVDDLGFFLYVASFSNPARVLRISLSGSGFSRVLDADGEDESVNFGDRARWFYRLAGLDASTNRLFVLSEDSPSSVVAVNSEDPSEVKSIVTLEKDEVHAGAATMLKGQLFVVTGTLPPKIVALRFGPGVADKKQTEDL